MEEPKESESMGRYFSHLQSEVDRCYAIATEARKKGYDPDERVDIPLAKNMAERVEGLLSIAAPDLVGKGVPQRISELEQKYGNLAWEIALIIAAEVAQEKFCKFKDKKEAMEVGIRAGFAYNTLGIVAAPLEGFIELKIKKRQDGKEYVAPRYAGPIRGAGGTAASVSVIIVDYVRTVMGYDKYDPTEKEVKRFITEVRDYHERVTNLQYFPSEEEVEFMVRHLPVEIDGEPTEIIDVSNYKDIPRLDTNKIRGGLCLVLAEGLTQKSPKLWKRLSKFGKDFGLEWDFLEDFLALQKKIKAKSKQSSTSKEKISPNYTYIKDLVAGRPILTYPMRPGGFRLRYGRSRLSGFSTDGMNPLTLAFLDNFVATGTQLKLERPGKACSITPNNNIDGPIVLLDDGSVVRIRRKDQVKECKKRLKKILFLGDICISYGDFSENGHILVPAGYCPEWWALELKKSINEKHGDLEKAALSKDIDLKLLDDLIRSPLTKKMSFKDAVNISEAFDVPLHPDFLFFWKLMDKKELLLLLDGLKNAESISDEGSVSKVIMKNEEIIKKILEKIGLPHIMSSKEFFVIEKDDARSLLLTLGLDELGHDEISHKIESSDSDDIMNILNKLCRLKIMDLAGTFIGARMGRPEKAKMRKLKGDPHALFPVGDEGGRMRSFQSALQKGKVTGDFAVFYCNDCKIETVNSRCEMCGMKTKKLEFCTICNTQDGNCDHPKKTFKNHSIDIRHHFQKALEKSGLKVSPDLVKGVKGTSNEDHIPENLTKGILRAKNGVFVNKDGTTRYDMSELPITHFKPREIGTSLERLKELGYDLDHRGKPITDSDQIIEIKPQDVILPDFKNLLDEPCSDVLVRIARFIDDIMINLYGLDPFYNVKSKDDLIGHLIIGLAPHISAGLIGRIIGFSNTQGFFTHPMFHAGMRRDCDGDEACVIMLMDAFLNFSRKYLPNKRGAKTMDSPLVLTSKLIPSEVDDQVHGLDVSYEYPLELYEAALEYKNPWDVKIDQIKHRLGKPSQYENMGFTHDICDINSGILCSAYKTLPSMKEKLDGQMKLACLIMAVDEADVARSVIEKHFLKDIKGNLRKFSTQKFRCITCNTKYRRPPLLGKCTTCGGKIVFTISEGSIVKYLGHSIELVENYNVSDYLTQTIQLTKRRIEDNFGKDKEKQTGLCNFCDI